MQNSIREKNQALNYLRLSSRIDAVAARLESAIRMKQVSRGVVVERGGSSSCCCSLFYVQREEAHELTLPVAGDEFHGGHRQRDGQGTQGDGRGEGEYHCVWMKRPEGRPAVGSADDGWVSRIIGGIDVRPVFPLSNSPEHQLAKVMDQFEKQFEDTDVR